MDIKNKSFLTQIIGQHKINIFKIKIDGCLAPVLRNTSLRYLRDRASTTSLVWVCSQI